jgi:hypothetical protein
MRSSKRYFPFSPGIPWPIKNSKYVIPNVNADILYNVVKDKRATVSAFGGLLESYYSLSILEMINYYIPGTDMFWSGNEEYKTLMMLNGLGKYSKEVNEKLLQRFPVPLFLDKYNDCYFNCLNNYIDIKTYYLTEGYKDSRAITKQIIEKGLFKWRPRFLPKFRRLDHYNPVVKRDLATANFSITHPFVLCVSDKTKYSKHDIDCIGWSPSQFKAYAAILYSAGIRLVIMTDFPAQYYGGQLSVLPLNFETYLFLAPLAKQIISKDVDFLLLGLGLSDCQLVSNILPEPFKLKKNSKFLNKSNDIFIQKELSPVMVYNFLNGADL